MVGQSGSCEFLTTPALRDGVGSIPILILLSSECVGNLVTSLRRLAHTTRDSEVGRALRPFERPNREVIERAIAQNPGLEKQ
jgi:hypothetical protein